LGEHPGLSSVVAVTSYVQTCSQRPQLAQRSTQYATGFCTEMSPLQLGVTPPRCRNKVYETMTGYTYCILTNADRSILSTPLLLRLHYLVILGLTFGSTGSLNMGSQGSIGGSEHLPVGFLSAILREYSVSFYLRTINPPTVIIFEPRLRII
jgi:hypothetical protein